MSGTSKRYTLWLTLLLALPLSALTWLSPLTLHADEDDDLRREILRAVEKIVAQQNRETVRAIERLVDERLSSRTRRGTQRYRSRIAELEQEVLALKNQVRGLRARLAGSEPGAGEQAESKPHHDSDAKSDADVASAPEAAAPSPAILGVAFLPVTEERAAALGISTEAVQVQTVLEKSPADRVGLRAGDVIVEVDGMAASQAKFQELLRSKQPGDRVELDFYRAAGGDSPMQYHAQAQMMARAEFAEAIERLRESMSEDEASESSGASGGSSGASGDPERKEGAEKEEREERRDAPAQKSDRVTLGVTLAESGLEIATVDEGSNGAEAGLLRGDVLIAIGGRDLTSVDDAVAQLDRLNAGSETTIVYRRKGVVIQARVRMAGTGGTPVLLRLTKQGPAEPAPQPAPPADTRERGFLGIQPAQGERGVEVTEVVAASPAAKMGLEVGDRIVSINGNRVRNMDDLKEVFGELYRGDSVSVVVRRGSRRRTLHGTLAAPPQSEPDAAPSAPAAPPAAPAAPSAGAPAAAANSSRPALGIQAVERDGRVVVDGVVAGGAAASAGLEVADVILRVGGHEVRGFDDLEEALKNHKVGQRITVRVRRDGRSERIRLVLQAADPPAEKETSAVAPKASARSLAAKKRWIGVTLEELSDRGEVRVVGLDRGGPAASAGWRRGDRVISIGGQAVSDLDAVERAIGAASTPIPVELERAGEAVQTRVEPLTQ